MKKSKKETEEARVKKQRNKDREIRKGRIRGIKKIKRNRE